MIYVHIHHALNKLHIFGACANVWVPTENDASGDVVEAELARCVVNCTHEHPLVDPAAHEWASDSIHSAYHVFWEAWATSRQHNSEQSSTGRDELTVEYLEPGVVEWYGRSFAVLVDEVGATIHFYFLL